MSRSSSPRRSARPRKRARCCSAAHAFEADARRWSERSEQLLRQHETIEVGSTLFEVAIVLVSITALVGSRLLPITAGVAAILGMVFVVAGLAL